MKHEHYAAISVFQDEMISLDTLYV